MEQRLVDVNNLGVGKANPDAFERKDYAYGWNSALQAVTEASPTIDPETLPLVRQLREELEREKRLCDDLQKDLAVTANERDAALERVKHYAGCWECKVREEGECAMPFFKDECSDWEWRGPQKKG